MSNGAGNKSFNSDIPEDRWVKTFIDGTFDADERVVDVHACEHCGRVMKYADQSCACTARDPWLR